MSDEKDNDNYQFPKSGKVYISPSLKDFRDSSRRIRIASKVTGENGGLEYAKELGEVVLRNRPDARTCIRAKFLEATGEIFILTLQKFDKDSGMPVGSGFTFVGHEIARLLEFADNIRAAAFDDGGPLNITDEELRKRVLTPTQAEALLAGNPEVFAEAVRQAVTKEDLVSLGYRRQQLETFNRLLNEQEYFDRAKAVKRCGDEALWQQFFEKNPWIFGYGLQYVYGATLDNEKLEQYVRGHTVLQPGKRVDGLLKSKAIASTLCFVEIKHHRTDLMAKQEYRGGCYAPSAQLSGAVAQIQGTVSYAAESLFGRHRLVGEDGFPLRSFELYRSHLHQPEIFTFDEIFERAKHIVSGNHLPLTQE